MVVAAVGGYGVCLNGRQQLAANALPLGVSGHNQVVNVDQRTGIEGGKTAKGSRHSHRQWLLGGVAEGEEYQPAMRSQARQHALQHFGGKRFAVNHFDLSVVVNQVENSSVVAGFLGGELNNANVAHACLFGYTSVRWRGRRLTGRVAVDVTGAT